MKTLLIRPGVEIIEKTLRGPWPPELSHLGKLYKQSGPFFRGFVQYTTFAYPSLLAAGTVIRRIGEDVEYIDIPFEFGIPLTDELNAQRHKKIEDYIAKGGYDVVGISCISSSESVATQRVAEAAKRAQEDVPVLIGGYQASSNALDLMEKIPAIDVIALGDFEPISEQLYAAFEGKIPLSEVPNVMYRDNGKIKTSERKHIKVEPEDLPVYDYSLVEKYISRYAMFAIEASRGCPYECSYCQEKVLRKTYSVKDATVAVDEFINTGNYILQFVKPVLFFYSDPLWGLDSKWVKDFCSQLIERIDEIKSKEVGWVIESRIGLFDDEALSLMKKARCISIGYGVESFSPRMLTMMKKTKDPQKYITTVYDTVEKTMAHGIQTAVFILVGMPGETHETMNETIAMMRSLPLKKENFHGAFSLAHSLHGTLLDEQIHDPQFVEEHGVKILDENDWEKVYLPRLSLLFDPSRDLSASELTDIYLNLSNGTTLGVPSPEKQLEIFKVVRTVAKKDEISPEMLAQWSRSFRRIASAHFKSPLMTRVIFLTELLRSYF
jgi:tRNA A37 methylthiotransferase MiaB